MNSAGIMIGATSCASWWTHGSSRRTIEPERALRPAVIVRQVSHGSKNGAGAPAFAAFTSVVRTLAKHGVDSLVENLYQLFCGPDVHATSP
jgi:hypothetical protein